MGPIRDPNVAVAAVVVGLLIGYIELLRPGLVIAGVAGLVLVMLGIASLSAHPVHAPSLLLIVAAFALVYLDARFRLNGSLGIAGAALMAAGIRYAFVGAVRWPLAIGVSLPYMLITVWLLQLAIRARLNKYTAE
jgi:membrane-bound serine protease (ClpP class)